jgi:hypothetical protein
LPSKKKAPADAFIACTPKRLPLADQHAAAVSAIRENPQNGANVSRLSELGIAPSPAHIAVLTTKWWGSGGVHLSVGVFQKISQAMMDRLLLYANKWGQWANVQFTAAPVASADVRIDLSGDGYWSYLGTDVRQIARGEPTMTLQGFSLSTPAAEWDRVVPHEFGHTLGCPHEHQRREIIQLLDEAKVIASFKASQGWSEQEIRQQILTPLEESSLMGTPHAEADSCMAYQFPGSVTKNGQPIPGGTHITESDGKFLNSVYPKSGGPPPTGPAKRLILEFTGEYKIVNS